MVSTFASNSRLIVARPAGFFSCVQGCGAFGHVAPRWAQFGAQREFGRGERWEQTAPISLIRRSLYGGQCRTRTCDLLLVRQAL